VGATRRVVSIKDRLNKNLHTSVKSDWATDIDGAAAEMAFAKYMGVYFHPTCNTFKHPDVGVFQVRSTVYETGHLIVRSNDEHDDEIFVLAIIRNPTVRLAGAFRCGDAKRDEFFKAGDSSGKQRWEVPQGALLPLPQPVVQ